MKILINERLSEHRCKTPEGYLICTDAILARTGKQTYRKNEIFKDSDDETEIEVDRTEDEVFSPQTLASFENKPVTVEHPDEDVNVHNYKEYAVGFVRDVHRGEADGQPVILGNLVITDEQTIQEIENGEHLDLSCGYDCDIADEANPCQRNIRGNHVALCECGRAGIARIVDSTHDANHLPAKVKRDLQKFLNYKSTFIRNKDYDIAEFVKEFERVSRLWAEFPLEIVRESIKGWFKTGDGMMRKDYVFSIEGYDDRFMVSIYAKPDTYETTELNAYFTDSVRNRQSSKLGDKDSFKPGDKIRHIEGDVEVIDKIIHESTFSGKIVKKYVMKSGRKYLAEDIETDHWHKMTDSCKDFIKDEQLYGVEFSYDGDSWSDYLGHVNVRAKSEQDALTKVKRWAVEHYDNPGFFKIASTKYTNVETIDSIKDAKFEICYIDNGDVCIAIEAKDENDARRKFRRRYGMYYIKHIRKIKDSIKDMIDCDINDESLVYDAWNINDDVYVNVGDGIYHHAKLISKEGNGAFNACVVKDLVTGKTIKTVMNRLRLFTKDPTHDALIPPTKEAINKFEVLLRIFDISIDRKALTPLGRVHYQVRANMEFDQFVKRLNRIDNEMDELGIPMTFNAGSDGKTCTAGIDLDKQYVKDSQRAQKIIKAVKSIK